jgi:triacylglycerol lipase
VIRGRSRAFAVAVAIVLPAASAQADHVLLVHGLLRSHRSMQPLAQHLDAAGFVVHNVDYPSRSEDPEALVRHLAGAVESCCQDGDGRIHFVTHSLGGILVRAYLAQTRPPRLGRVVQLAPPNHGSELVDHLGPLAELLGPTGSKLGTGAESLPNRLPPPDYEIGVIAGTGSLSPGSALIPGEDDGTVSLASTRLAGATDFLVMDASHTFIMQREDVARQVEHFLRTGSFVHEPSDAESAAGGG